MKLCSLEGQVSTLALILEGEMYLISFWLEYFSTQCSVIKMDFLDPPTCVIKVIENGCDFN